MQPRVHQWHGHSDKINYLSSFRARGLTVNIVLDALLLFCREIDDATPVMLIVFLLFVLPANLDFLQFNSNGKSP